MKKIKLLLTFAFVFMALCVNVNAKNNKKPILELDKSNNKTVEAGDRICYDAECFVVTSVSSTTFNGLALYNLSLNENPVQTKDNTDVTIFASSQYWYSSGVMDISIGGSSSKIYPYVTSYASYLTSLGYSAPSTITIPSKSNVEENASIRSGYATVYPTEYRGDYWLRTSWGSTDVYYMNNTTLTTGAPLKDKHGIRVFIIAPLDFRLKDLSALTVTDGIMSSEYNSYTDEYTVQLNDNIKKFNKDNINLTTYYDDAVVTYDDEITLSSGETKQFKIKVTLGSQERTIILNIKSGKMDCSVKFDTNSGSVIETQIVVGGVKIVKPEDPTRSGYTFAGWYTDKALTKEFDFDSVITEDITLYAKWTVGNPKTLDNIVLWIGLALASVVGLVCIYSLKRKLNK